MPFDSPRSLAGAPSPALRFPLAGAVVFALCAVYLLPGLLGHDPWKSEDAIGLGILHAMLESDRLLTLELAGEPYYGAGPLYFWVAAIAAKLTSAILPTHDGARLASLCGVGAALYFTRLTARELYGKTAGDLSLLALMGSLGLLIHARETAPETLALAGLAIAYYGIAIAWKKATKAGLVFGVGLAVTFLSKGLAHTLPPAIAALLLIPFALARAQSTTTRGYIRAIGIGAVIAILIVGAWFVAVHLAHPDYLYEWLAAQWESVANIPQLVVSESYLKTLAWSAWPIWPLTLWAAWAYRRMLGNPGFAVPLIAALVSITLLIFSDVARELDALALLVPLAIPAGAVAMQLRRGAANALAWFSVMTAALLAIALWVMWVAMMTGFPAKLAANVAKLEPGFIAQFEPLMFAAAVGLSCAWGWFVARAELSTLRALPTWMAGLALTWGLAMTLWLSWVDYGKTYRIVAQGAQAALASQDGCVASRGLGTVQRAVFHYHAKLQTERVEVNRGHSCKWLLVQGRPEPDMLAPGWTLIWEGARPRDRERYRLYARAD